MLWYATPFKRDLQSPRLNVRWIGCDVARAVRIKDEDGIAPYKIGASCWVIGKGYVGDSGEVGRKSISKGMK